MIAEQHRLPDRAARYVIQHKVLDERRARDGNRAQYGAPLRRRRHARRAQARRALESRDGACAAAHRALLAEAPRIVARKTNAAVKASNAGRILLAGEPGEGGALAPGVDDGVPLGAATPPMTAQTAGSSNIYVRSGCTSAAWQVTRSRMRGKPSRMP